MGNLTRDPELRVTNTGLSICKLSLAVNRTYTTKEGDPIMVEGRLKLDQWETNEGQKRSKLGVVLENFQFIGGRDSSASAPNGASSASEAQAPQVDEGNGFDEEVPF